MPEFIDPKTPHLGVTPHLAPNFPYVEKADSSNLGPGFRTPDRLSVPIDINKIRQWLKTCDAHHHCNASTPLRDAGHAAWLVDVSRRCIVPFKNEPYVALSYVWGKASSVSLTKSNLSKLRTPGALSNEPLPKTILDAMTLVASLGLQYLWIDRLCIIQDDVAGKQSQIQSMASIYASSYFTIVAAQSHDAAGPLSSRPLRPIPPQSPLSKMLYSLLPGLKGGKQPRSSQHLATARTSKEALNLHSIDLIHTVWFSRGWTFQEWLFSRRRILFHNNTVNWECRLVALHEEQCLAPLSSSTRNSHLHLGDETWGNFHRYARLAALFAPRKFTFPQDVHDAFAGAAGIFSRVFEGGLITGLPGLCFDEALLWQPYCPMQRRKAVVTAVDDDDAVMPSWSWMSCRGNVQSEAWAPGWAYLDASGPARGREKPPRWLVRPTVEWKHAERLGPEWHKVSTEKRPDEIPQGWDWDEEQGCFTTPGSVSGQRFSYPVPLGSDPARISHRSRLLRCTTRVARFSVHPAAYNSFAGDCSVLALLSPGSRSSFAGCLRVNRFEHAVVGEFPKDPIVLIELSEGFVELSFKPSKIGVEPSSSLEAEQKPDCAAAKEEQRGCRMSTEPVAGEKQEKQPEPWSPPLMAHPLADVFDEWSLPQWKAEKFGGRVYEFVNVMWVTFDVDNLAERVAVGRVRKKAWEMASKETMDVTIR
ncbi:heterokaryon incompatibility protein-domain-containing protein [Cladorrhinum samala]|uniref:Heterokaryon incompatibility protein-domain-containing protein n=1 Tax=Cladorrhinum samala TaxID=585594 RepID=A0AAV9HJ24_9PEZI|nr:heterokaryon incompatibility protein-domain-containing protein [Cladorrhinum samala]